MVRRSSRRPAALMITVAPWRVNRRVARTIRAHRELTDCCVAGKNCGVTLRFPSVADHVLFAVGGTSLARTSLFVCPLLLQIDNGGLIVHLLFITCVIYCP